MLLTIQPNTQANIVVDFPKVDGATIAPTSATFRVTDEVGSIIVPATAYTLASETQCSVEIGPQHNVMETGRTRAMRVVEFTFTAPTGTHTAVSRYVVENASLLVPMENSFQTFEEALLTRLDLPTFDGWDLADEPAQISALVTAHDRMCRLTYRYKLSQNAISYDSSDPYWHLTDIRNSTVAEFERWPADFKKALRRAQLFESDQILKGDPVGDKRRSGVVSESIGEAKMFFNARPPLRLALCVQAMEVLSPHLYSSRRIGRA